MKMLLKLCARGHAPHLAPAVVLPPGSRLRPGAEEGPAGVAEGFEAFIAKFRAALKANDSAAVAGMSKLHARI